MMSLNTALRTARANAIVLDAGSGAILRFYTASRPSTGAAITTQTLLATVVFSGVLGTVSGGVITLGNPSPASPVSDGVTSWARLFRSDGTTFVADFDVAASGADINLGSSTLSTSVQLDISGGTITEGNA